MDACVLPPRLLSQDEKFEHLGVSMRMLLARGLVIAFYIAISGCAATPYQKCCMHAIGGGFDDQQVKDDVWRMSFIGNPSTTFETAQAYWLLHCAELALDKGYTGFEVLTDMRLTFEIPIDKLSNGPSWDKAHVVYTPIIVPGGDGGVQKLEGDVRLLHGDVQGAPPKKYNASDLKKQLDLIVNGKKCNNGNVCPHVHDYIYGPGGTSS